MQSNNLWNQEIVRIGDIEVKLESCLGNINNIEYYQCLLINESNKATESKRLLLRVGSTSGALVKEQELREILGPQKFLPPLLGITIQKSPDTELDITNVETEQLIENKVILEETPNEITEQEILTDTIDQSAVENTVLEDQEQTLENETENSEINVKLSTEYLEEETYPEEPVGVAAETELLLVLTEFPTVEKSLEHWLKQPHTPTEVLLVAGQICQLFCLLARHNWCVLAIAPQFVQMDIPPTVFDLTAIHPLEQPLLVGLQGSYFPPELITGGILHPHTSTYIIGLILLQGLFPTEAQDFLAQDFTTSGQWQEPALPLHPKLYQILKTVLASNPDERFSLEQLLSLLIETRVSLQQPQLSWQIASHSTVGLSLHRLQNEDNFGVKQSISNQDQILLAAIADGMGGMAEGEVASKLAIDTVLNASFPEKINNPQERQSWLEEIFNLANRGITNTVKNGGTTLSLVLAFNQKLQIAHVGDSRIYLLRKGIICQLSEDHSLVAMLLNSDQISYEESLNHPERNVLIKSLGNQPKLNPGHVQNLTYFNSDNYLTLENDDLLILCSDGVWDLINSDEMGKIFSNNKNLQTAVNNIIHQVLERGANDNATLVALKLSIRPSHL
jgi:protein phosphatase